MRLSYAVFLALITVIGSTASITAEALAVYPDHASTDELRGMRRTRLLRAEKATNEDGEERGNLLTKIASVFKSKNPAKVVPIGEVNTLQLAPKLAKKVKQLKSKAASLNDVFKKAKLGGIENPNAKIEMPTAKQLFESDRLPMYVKFSEETFKPRGSVDKWGIETLTRNGYSELDLMRISNYGFTKGDDVAKQTAKRLRGGLLDKWFLQDKPAHEVAQFLKAGKKTMDPFNEAAYKNYVKAKNSVITGNPIAFNPLV
ncbi:Avirulence (Avh) protein [Phytophthora megakarya]|uniref:RxLR effector protein n=1 Tax=Phytophthora megakarya TaxID=4795 RepID=A0A225VRZ4_9STRA|nr:Avirulence (Avh) protein [Phytophthora megakarya]